MGRMFAESFGRRIVETTIGRTAAWGFGYVVCDGRGRAYSFNDADAVHYTTSHPTASCLLRHQVEQVRPYCSAMHAVWYCNCCRGCIIDDYDGAAADSDYDGRIKSALFSFVSA